MKYLLWVTQQQRLILGPLPSLSISGTHASKHPPHCLPRARHGHSQEGLLSLDIEAREMHSRLQGCLGV